MNCLICQNNIHLCYQINEIYLINIGNINTDFIFNSSIIIEVKNKEFQKNNLVADIIKNNIQNAIKDFNSNTSLNCINIKNDKGDKIGTAYKILKNGENQENYIKDNNKLKVNSKHIRIKKHIDENSIKNNKEKKSVNDNNKDRYKNLFDEEKLQNEDLSINSEFMKLIKLIIYLQEFTIKKNTSLKNKEEKIGYPVEKEFLNRLKNLKSYQIIEKYINKNSEIQKIIAKFKVMEKKEDNFLFNNIIK